MSDLKRECPACHSYTSAIGQAIEDREPCPYCGYDLRTEPGRMERQFDELIRRARADAWDEGHEATARFHEGPKGHWENDHPRKGLRSWVADPAPANPYQADQIGEQP